MRYFFAATVALACSTASAANLNLQLGTVTLTTNFDLEIFDFIDIGSIGPGYDPQGVTTRWALVASFDLSNRSLPDLTFNFNVTDNTYRVLATAYFEPDPIPAYSVLYSLPQANVVSKLTTVGEHWETPTSGSFLTSSSAALGGYGLKPSTAPTCASLSCMTPFKADGTYRLHLTVQSVPEVETGGLAVAGGLIAAAVIRRRRAA